MKKEYNYLRMKSKTTIFSFFVLVSILLVNINAQSDATVYIDSTEQVIRGFGAANILPWRADMTSNEIQTAFGTDDGQLGFSILRLRLPNNQSEFASNVSTAKAAYDMGVKIIASPWSPPSSMKTNNNPIGGRLSDNSYQDYADHLKSFADYMEDNGVPLYAISVQNEPDISVSYESCDWTPEQMTRFMKENAASIDVDIIAPESYQFKRPISDAILNDSEAAANLSIVGGHIYGGGLVPYPLAEEKGKEVWMTEHLTESGHSGNIWSYALDVGKEMQQVMNAGMNAYIWWYIVRYYGPIGDGETSVSNPNEDFSAKGEVTKKGFVMSQFSRFIRPEYYKIKCNYIPQRDVYTTAYKDSSSSKVVIVAVNTSTSAKEQKFVLEEGTANNFSVYVTSESKDCELGSDIAVTGNSFTVTLDAQSVTTFVSDSIMTTSVGENFPLPENFNLYQNYPNPFNPTTQIKYSLPESGAISLKVFNLLGQKVATLYEGIKNAGTYEITFNGEGLANGIYVYQLKANNFVETKKLMLLK